MKNLIVILFSLVISMTSALTFAEEPILVIGASYGSGSTPFNDDLNAPLGGVSVGLGSYLSLGNALIRNPSLSGHVINEAQAGATTFDRQACNPTCTPDVIWQGYDKQLTKALARVSVTNPITGNYDLVNTKYVVITKPNDCSHSDAFGIPQSESVPCATAEFNALADRLIAIGQRVIDLDLIPIFINSPSYAQLDMQLFKTTFGLDWVIDNASYDEMLNILKTRIAAELPKAVQLNAWKKFTHVGDGIHPDQKSTVNAAKIIARFILKNDCHKH